MSDLLTPTEIEACARAGGLTMAQVCKRANVAQSTFSRWKAGSTEPTIGVYRRIVDAARGHETRSGAARETQITVASETTPNDERPAGKVEAA